MKTDYATVKDCVVENSLADGIWVAMGSANATVQGNTVTNSADHGIWVGGASWCPPVNCPNATIINNIVNGAREGGISFVNSDNATIEGNTVTNVKGQYSPAGWSVGAISLKDGVSNVIVRDNLIHGNIMADPATDSGRGIGVDGTSSNIAITGNTIRDNAGGGIKVMGTVTGWSCNFNSIYGNTGYGVENTTGTPLDFKKNWWGAADGPSPSPGSGDRVSDHVNYSPWWCANYVGDPHTSPWVWGADDDIQDAIEAASPGDTINVAAGTYEEVIEIDKALTLLGAQAGIDARTRSGVAESIIDPNDPDGGAAKSWVVRVQSSDVTVDGFTVQNPTLEYGSAGLFCVEAPPENPYQNLIFRNNILQNPGIKTSASTDHGKFGYDIGICDNVLIEYNYIRDILCDTATPWNATAAIWPYYTRGLTIRHNKIEHVTTFGVGLSMNNDSNVLILENEVSLGDPGEDAVPSEDTAGIRVGPAQNDDVHIEGNSVYNCPGTAAQPGAGIRIQTYFYLDFATQMKRDSFTYAIDNLVTGCPIGVRITADATYSQIEIEGNRFEDNEVQVSDGAKVLIIEDVLTGNTFDRAVTVNHPGDSLLHTIWSSIQDAIEAALSEDTINVAAGTYFEAIVIDKQLTLNGANADVNAVTGPRGSESIIIDGGDSTAITISATISADDVIVDGFTLDGGITLDDTANPISGGAISNNIITGADNPEDPPKAQNGIRLGWDYGKGVDGVTIENNIITKSLCKGIRFASPKQGSDGGTASNITISGNEIKDNGSAGMETYGPGLNIIINNIISGNDGNGINLKFDDGDVVTGNIITNNDGPGISLRDVTNTIVENNSMSGHQSTDVIKSWPDVDGGRGSGIHILFASENNTIRFNNISGNNYGIFIHSKEGKGLPSGNSINFNNIYGNTYDGKTYGILNALVDPLTSVDATNNWWGDKSGPTHPDNPDGTGNEVSNYVDYDPWLGAEAEDSESQDVSGTGGTISADDSPTGGQVTVTGAGIPAGTTVTSTKYTGNPGGTPGFRASGNYYDVHLDDDTGVNSLTVEFCPATASTVIYYWNGTSWAAASNQSYSDGCVTVTITPTSSPSLSDLSGLPFGSGTPVAPVGGGGGARTPTTYQTMSINMLGKVATVRVSSSGELLASVTVADADNNCILEFGKGTRIVCANNQPPQRIELKLAGSLLPPSDTVIVGPMYELSAYTSKYSSTPSPITISPAASLALAYNPDNVPENTRGIIIAYYDEDAGKWIELETAGYVAGGVEVPNTVTSQVNHFTTFAVLAKLAEVAPAKFSISNLTINPTQAQLNQEVIISVTVTNSGGTAGDYNVRLTIDDVITAAKQITLAPETSQTVSFTINADAAGKHQVEVAGLTGEFEILGQPSTGFNWWLIGGVLILVLLSVLWLSLMRRRLSS